ncbi:hypothetical protein CYMTET_40451 [Cymbomonas tetramitiformis]|uniref:Polycystin cation channel PKD1/PKD2 domain-containing protein n=1 Tax=Cymbomonas tetramitiformis TaxID=36881 RepID=A0AAE0CA44_9CHLO|nr:hypothetical protein CYMTET_40451 [Cymbomonas tetramitiformis]
MPPPPPIVIVRPLEYEDEDEEEVYVPPADTSPPAILLNGAAYVEVFQREAYTDLGATANDVVDGNVAVHVEGLGAVDTSTPTPADEPFILTYTAQDNSNNSASPVERQVAVVSPCEAPSFLCGETSIVDEAGEEVCATCTVSGGNTTCLCLTEVLEEEEEGAPVVEEYIPEPDTEPPSITLRGDGQLGVTTDGTMIMIHYVVLNSDFEVPGADAEDAVDGNLTSHVASYGTSTVDSSIATPDDAPYVVSYDVSDAAGNKAVTMRRRVYVLNPCSLGEFPCDDDLCSENGGLCETLDIEYADEDEDEVDTPPVLTLIGSAEVEIEAGYGYTACKGGDLLSSACDQGAEATDQEDGEITDEVRACSPDEAVCYKFSSQGIAAAGVNGTIPGVYLVLYYVEASNGARAYATRTVTVTPACDVGERVCLDRVSCSLDDLCVDELDTNGLSDAAEEDTAPNMTLVTHALVGQFVDVRQYSAYEACAAATAPEEDALCDPGVTVEDAEDGNLTAAALSCPPDSCISTGCPGHEFRAKGLQGCLDTSAEVGTVFSIRFIVFDHATPANMASVIRTVTIAAPCDAGYELCDDGVCSSVPCEDRNALLASDGPEQPDSIPPNVTLRGAGSLRLFYGRPAVNLSLTPCVSEDQVEGCYATAEDMVDGDVSGSITLSEIAAADGTGCMASEVVRATCFPGTYRYVYNAADAAGNVARAVEITVEVVEVAEMAAELNLAASSGSLAGAEAEAAALQVPGTAEAAAFRSAVAHLLGDAQVEVSGGMPVTAEDVNVTGVVVVVETAGYSLRVQFTVLAMVAGDEKVAGGRRHLTADEAAGEEGAASPAEALAAEFAAALEAGAAPSANGGDPALSGYLVTAAEAEGAALTAEVEGLEGNATTREVTVTVDELTAMHAVLLTELEDIQAGVQGSNAAMEDVEAMVAEHSEGPDPDLQQSSRTDSWSLAYDAESENVQTLGDSMAQMLENAEALEQMAADLEQTANEVAEQAEEQQRELEAGLQGGEGSRNETGGGCASVEECLYYPPHPPPAPPPASGGDLTCNVTEFPPQVREHHFNVSSSYLSQPSPPPPPPQPPLPPPPLSGTAVSSQTVHSHRALLARASTSGSSSTESSSGDTTSAAATTGSSSGFTGVVSEEDGVVTATRALARMNELVGGMSVISTRRESRSCTERFFELQLGTRGGHCFKGPLSDKPFGVDPVFSTRSSLYNVAVGGLEEDFYNMSAQGVDLTNGKTTARPFTVAAFEIPRHPRESFFIWYGAELSGDRANEMSTFVTEGHFLDEATASLEVGCVAYNAAANIFTTVKVRFTRSSGGSYIADYTITPLNEALWLSYEDPRTAASLAILAVGIIWRVRSDLQSVQSASSQPISILPSVLLVFGVVMYTAIVVYHQYFFLESAHEVYDDKYAVAHYLLLSRNGESVSANEDAETARWAMPVDSEHHYVLMSDIGKAETSSELQRAFWALQVLCILALVLHLISCADFQKRLAFVGETLRTCTSSLGHLLLVLFLLTFMQGMVANIVMGYSCERYSTFVRSQHTVFDALISGGIESCDSRFATAHQREVPTIEQLGVSIFIAFFTLLNLTIVMNFFWTIIGDSLGGDDAAKDERRESPDVISQLLELLDIVRSRVRGNWPRQERLQEVLEACDFVCRVGGASSASQLQFPEVEEDAQESVSRAARFSTWDCSIFIAFRELATKSVNGLLTKEEGEDDIHEEEAEEIYVADVKFKTRNLARVLWSLRSTGVKPMRSKWTQMASAITWEQVTKKGPRQQQSHGTLQGKLTPDWWHTALARSMVMHLNESPGGQGEPPECSDMQQRRATIFHLVKMQKQMQARAQELERRGRLMQGAEAYYARRREPVRCEPPLTEALSPATDGKV